jgi:PilZ domain
MILGAGVRAMQHLTGEWFEDLIRSVNTRETGDQRRRVPRIGVRFSAEMFEVDGERVLPPVTIRIRDISPLGLGFSHNRRLRKGTRFIIQLPQEELAPLRILCEVKNCETVADQVYAVGAEFVQIGLKSQAAGDPDLGAATAPVLKPDVASRQVTAGAKSPANVAGAAIGQPVPAAAGASQAEIDSMAEQVRKAMFE